MQRTIRIQLQPDIETARALTQAIEQYTWSFNAVCKYGWKHNLTSGTELHKATYYEHRTITGLPAQQVLCSSCESDRSAEICQSKEAQKRNSFLSTV